MSTTHTLPYTRFVRQVRTEPMALLATAAAAAQAEALLRAAPWQQVSTLQSTIPARDKTLQRDGFEPTWDAFKFPSNYSAGSQRAYAGMASYRFQIPAAALTGPAHIISIAMPLHVDRWLVDGVRVAAYVSASPEPSTDWATLRAGIACAEAELPMLYTEDEPPARIVVDKTKSLTVTLPVNTDALAYLYVVVSLEDYATIRGFWIEGGAMIIGTGAVTTFDASVVSDALAWRPIEAVTAVRGSDGVTAYEAHNFAVVGDGLGTRSKNQMMASFPLTANRASSGVNGDTGFVVGVGTSNVVSGGFAVRHTHVGDKDRFTKLRFGNAAFLPLTGKTVQMRLNVWVGNVVNTNLSWATFETPKLGELPVVGSAYTFIKASTGLYQAALFNGTSPLSVETFISGSVTGNPVTATTALGMGTWNLQNVGQFDLSGKNYASTDVFNLAPIIGAGIKVILVTIRPLSYWGTIGTNTTTTWKPGEVWTIA